MEHLVRVLNERDRRTLAWLRQQVGDEAVAEAASRCGPSKPYVSMLCHDLGLSAPRFPPAGAFAPTEKGEQSLAQIRSILARSLLAGASHRVNP